MSIAIRFNNNIFVMFTERPDQQTRDTINRYCNYPYLGDTDNLDVIHGCSSFIYGVTQIDNVADGDMIREFRSRNTNGSAHKEAVSAYMEFMRDKLENLQERMDSNEFN